MTGIAALPNGSLHGRADTAHPDEIRPGSRFTSRYPRIAAGSYRDPSTYRDKAVLPRQQIQSGSGRKLGEDHADDNLGGGVRRPPRSPDPSQRRRVDRHEIIRRILIGGVVLLVFITSFRVAFYWGERMARQRLAPAAQIVPNEAMPPIWWRP